MLILKNLAKEWKQLWVTLGAIFAFLTSAYAYIKVDIDPFIKSTEIVAAAGVDRVYVQVDVNSEVNENTIIIVNIDDQQVAQQIYPMGLDEGKYFFDVGIPFTSDSAYLEVEVEIVFYGLRTLFTPKKLSEDFDVERITTGDGSGIRPAIVRS